MSQKRILLLLCLLTLVALAACARPTPIPVYVTPTPVSGTEAVVEPVTAAATDATPGGTATVTPSPTASPTLPPGITIGPIVPPEYTLPPTFTPRPTVTPTPGTPTPSATPTISPTPLPFIDPARVGIQIHPRVTQDEWRYLLSKAQELGVGWIKVQFEWDLLQPDGPGDESTESQMLELYMQDALMRGFQVMISITRAPDWARSTTEANGPPTDPQALADFIQTILDRDFGRALSAIEIWNEPNLIREWTGAPMTGSEYMRLFRPAYETITRWSSQSGHRIQLITAGLAPTGTSEFSADDRAFLEQMYQAGLANYPDVMVGIHPYGWGNAPDARCCDPVADRGWDDNTRFFFLDNIDAYRQIMRRYGAPPTQQLWITEFGWATYDGLGGYPAPQPFFDYVNEWSQANYTIEALDILQNSGNYNDIGPTILWNLNFALLPGAVSERREEQAGYSLLRPDGSERPVYQILRMALNP